jgi:hypothetical protein
MKPWLWAFLAGMSACCARAEPTWVPVLPSASDPAIHRFNTPHWICVDRDLLLQHPAQDRHELLLFLPGTGGHVRGAPALLETAASLGYRCIELMYPDDVAAAQVCWNDPDPGSFEKFRMAIIEGGVSPHITVSRTDSIENRLIKLLQLLEEKRPRENWSMFLRRGAIAWDRIAVAGQSQGGGHAGLIGIKHRVARVLMFGAPKDYSRAARTPASWYREPKATPVAAFFAINHRLDRMGCSFEQQLENLHELGMDKPVPMVDVDHEPPPYKHSRMLTTADPGTWVDSRTAHATALNPKNQQFFRPVWAYFLTERISTDS